MGSAMHGESGYARIENDLYETPEWCTEALLSVETFKTEVWEPACGKGAISRVLKRHGYEVVSTDIVDYDAADAIGDFLNYRAAINRDFITNPPYSHAQDFIEKALIATEAFGRKVAMLLRNEYDSAKSRRHLFADHPAFTRKWVLTKRPRWVADNKASPRHNFAWFVWDWERRPYDMPTIGYLPIDTPTRGGGGG